jgi:hypothetical protein
VDDEGRKSIPRNGGLKMEKHAKQTDTEIRDSEMDEELVDVLTAISVVSKRLARKLTALSRQDRKKTEGGKSDEQDE